ncbi:hypothetical protein DID80_08220 [Candidatus Marinamargulisbacteria bacterium SCGC AAA071-K20]|nr:hypothetical protein DID80_08220 [Candidatus Marinamargulisbacteria bacterium SCGC AAA071-K20]
MKSSEIDNAINLIDYLRTILSYKFFIIIFILGSLFLCSLFNHFSPEVYRTHTVFFINSDSPAQSGLMRNVSLLTGSNNSNINNYIVALINSKRIKKSISNNLKLKYFKKLETNEVISKLNLYKNVKIKKDAFNVFKLSYENQSPKLAYDVISEYIRLIPQLNKVLNLSPKKEIITVLDVPFLPTHPYKPRKLMNLVITTILSTSLSFIMIFLHAGFKSSML